MSVNGLAVIRSFYPDLSGVERRIADYILNHTDKTIHLTVAQLADETRI